MDIINTIKSLGSVVEKKVSNLNRGGCGNYAWALALHLRETVDPNVSFVMDRMGGGFLDQIDLDEIREEIRPSRRTRINEWCRRGACFHHIRVKFTVDGQTYVADSEQVLTIEQYKKKPHHKGEMFIEELSGMIRQGSREWNMRFDRKQIPKVYETIDQKLNKMSKLSALKLAYSKA